MGYEEFVKNLGHYGREGLPGLSVSVGQKKLLFSEEAARHLDGRVVCLFDPDGRKMAFRLATANDVNGYTTHKPRGGRSSQINCGAFMDHVFGKNRKTARYRATWNGTLLEVDLNAGPIT